MFSNFSLFRLYRKDEISFDIAAKNGNNVEATFDFVERIVRRVAFDNVSSTLLLQVVDGALVYTLHGHTNLTTT